MTLDEFIKTANLRGLANVDKGCLFCKTLNEHKEVQVELDFEYEYTAAIVTRLFKVGNPHSRATSTNYGHGKFTINYCPMCGRKLEVDDD